MIRDMTDREHPSMRMPNHHRRRKAALIEPRASESVVLDRLGDRLECTAFEVTTVSIRQNVVTSTVVRKAREPTFGEVRRQEPRRPDIEIHRVPVKQLNRSADVAVG